ncbi:MAG: Holliday junction resolvase RuvX [Janthinobacterium lividum]
MAEGGFRRGVRVGLDWGDARIGVARCDPDGILATPYATVRAGEREIADLLAVLAELEPIEVVVGLPTTLAGTEGPATRKVRERAGRLAAATPLPVRLVDERFTTVEVSRRMSEGGRRAKDQRSVIDSAAAAAILEHALSVERSSDGPPGALLLPNGRA